MLACQPADDLPPVQVEGEILTYAADEDICDGTVEYGERWMKAVGTRLGISPDELRPTTYYRVSQDEAFDRCGAPGCARVIDGEVRIFAPGILNKHELVHAVHLSAWPRRRPLLTEGLAMLLDDSNRSQFVEFDQFGFDVDAAIEQARAADESYVVGVWIVHWVIARHGFDAFRDFWHADTKNGSAEEFRALFEQHFGESLDTMLAAVAGHPACPLATCVEDVVAWQGDLWTTESPMGCGDGLTIGSKSTTDPDLERAVLLDVPESGTYAVSVSDSVFGNGQGVVIQPCGGGCGQFPNGGTTVYSGSTGDVVWEPGLYRVTTFKLDATDPGVRVEIRPK
ncbi:hypothetical protein ACNOYE_08930 [Nannocystaceae bacterium ST9]